MTELKLTSDFAPASQTDWLAAVESALKGKSADTLVSNDLAGFTRHPLYTEAQSATQTDEAGLPGFAPFTRGARAVNNKFLPWHIAQRAIIGRANADNAAILTDLAGGVSAITLDFTDKTADADALDKLLDGVMLDIAPLNLVPGKHGMDAVQAVLALFEKRDIAADAVGFLNLDPLAATAQFGESGAVDYAALAALATSRPGLRLMTSAGAAYHAIGASVPQELGWMLAGLTAYIRALEAAGMNAADALAKITLTVAADVDFFATLAKIRAARLLFANIAEAIGAADVRPQIHAETSLRAFSDIDPWVNILRATAASMGAGIAGIDLMTVAPCTASSATDNQLTRRIARNTQIILQEESHIGQVTDAAGGSWYVEQLTRELAEAAWAEFQAIETAGGLQDAIADGTIAAALQAQTDAYKAAVDKRALPLVGVSEFPNIDEAPLEAAPNAVGYRHAQGFEALRHAAQKAKPKVFLACIGEMADFTPRANFATNLYNAGGLSAVLGDGGTDAAAIAEAFKKSTAKIAVICGSDADYDTHADAVAAALADAGATHIALAGKPRNNAQIDDYCFAGCAALSYLTAIHARLGL
jgi:methylmalonyl-CoA mutase